MKKQTYLEAWVLVRAELYSQINDTKQNFLVSIGVLIIVGLIVNFFFGVLGIHSTSVKVFFAILVLAMLINAYFQVNRIIFLHKKKRNLLTAFNKYSRFDLTLEDILSKPEFEHLFLG